MRLSAQFETTLDRRRDHERPASEVTAYSGVRGRKTAAIKPAVETSGRHMVSRLIRFIPKCSWSALVCQDFTMVGRQCSAPGAGEASKRPSGGTFRRRRRQAPRQNARFCHFSRSKGRILEQSKELTLTGKRRKRRPRLQSGEAGFQTRGNARYINLRGFRWDETAGLVGS
jgi:hypothetical protein